MPVTSVHDPDGNVIQVQHPEGASDAEIISYAKENYAKENNVQEAPKISPTVSVKPKDVGFFESLSPRGVADMGLTVGSSALLEPVAGLAGLATLPFGGVEGAANTVESVRNWAWEPKSPEGQRLGQAIAEGPIGKGFQALDRSAKTYLGDPVLEATGSPGLAAAAYTAPYGVLEVGGGLLGLNKLRGARRLAGATNKGLVGATDDVARKVRAAGKNADNLTPSEVGLLQADVADDALRQQGRVGTMRQAGLIDDAGPTRAQVTRNATDFQAQQEAAKASSRVRTRLENQEGILSQKFDDAIKGTGGQPVSGVSSAVDEVVSRSTRLDNEISALYRQARDMAPGAKNVRLEGLIDMLQAKSGSNAATNGLIRSVWGDLKARKIVGKKGKFQGAIDVDTAEEIRKFINSHYSSTSPLGKQVIRELKDALDDDVLRVAGSDVFDQARAAKASFESGLRRAKVSKWDARNRNLVRDVLENNIDPDDFSRKISTGKTYRAEDIRQLKEYLVQEESGVQAWNDVQAEVLHQIKRDAFFGPKDEAGLQAMTRASLERSLNRIGPAKLKELFGPDVNEFLDLMRRVSEIREPVRGTALGLGPTGQAVQGLQNTLINHPFIRGMVDAVTMDRQGRMVLRAKVSVPPTLRLETRPNVAAGLLVAGEAQRNK